MRLGTLLASGAALFTVSAAAQAAELTGYVTYVDQPGRIFLIGSSTRFTASQEIDWDSVVVGRRLDVTYDGADGAFIVTSVAPAAPEPAAPAPVPSQPPPPAPDVAQAPTPEPAPAPAGGVSSYTTAQADRGEDAYDEHCSACHGPTLGGGGESPGLIGNGFRNTWFTGSAATFFEYISSAMPQQAPGSLSPETYADITAYIAERNHIPAGESELPSDSAALAEITWPPPAE